MARVVYCRWPACRKPTPIAAPWKIPDICPACKRSAMWSTEPTARADEPTKPYVVTFNDRRFLHSLRILVEPGDEQPPDDDGA